MVRRFTTNLNCASCVAAVTPLLNGEPAIVRWSVDTNDPRKVLTIEGDSVSTTTVEQLVQEAGFRVLGGIEEAASERTAGGDGTPVVATYWPLLLIVGYLIGLVVLFELAAGSFQAMRAMGHFMGGCFIAFSFFKLLDLRGFAEAFRTYDVLARRSPAYGFVYPFMELALGVAYLTEFRPLLTNTVTLVIMLLGLVGVTQALVQKRRIQCACLGTVFNLPMSKVTFIEDALMAVMAGIMLTGFVHG